MIYINGSAVKNQNINNRTRNNTTVSIYVWRKDYQIMSKKGISRSNVRSFELIKC